MGAVLGAVLGSFIATWALRVGDGRTITGRSACDGCGRTLAPVDLVPLISWAVQGGRCRSCQTRIDPIHPLTELLAALIAGLSLWLSPDMAGGALMLFGLLLLALATVDARHFWLPHRLSATTALAGLFVGGLAMSALNLSVPLTDRLIGCVAGFALLWLVGNGYKAIRARQGLGGGDAPMLAAMGAWTGWQALPFLLLFAALAGLCVAGVRMARTPADAPKDWRMMRLPLGTLLALSAGPSLWFFSQSAT